MRLKSMVGTAIAAAALSVPYSASAAIAVNTDAPPLAEAFLAVWDVSSGNTYIQDLGINATTTNWNTAKFTETVNSSQYSTMFGTATASNLRYAVYAGLNNELGAGGSAPQDYLFFTAPTGTDTSSWLTVNPFGDLGQNLSRLDQLTNAHNTSLDYSINSTTTATSGAGSIGDNPGNVFNGSLTDASPRVANGLIGTALSWFQIGLDANTTGSLNVRNTFATWSFDGTTLTYGGAAAPLPAGIWLLGSALLGLVGVSRRRAMTAVA